eukprot:4267159-Prymnesium_polylepis.1
MHSVGFDYFWHCASDDVKGLILEFGWMALLRADRYVRPHLCEACLGRTKPPAAGKRYVGATCRSDYALGAPLSAEKCWFRYRDYCGPMLACEVTKNDNVDVKPSERNKQPPPPRRIPKTPQKPRARASTR